MEFGRILLLTKESLFSEGPTFNLCKTEGFCTIIRQVEHVHEEGTFLRDHM